MSLGALILLGIVITRFLVPISIATLSLFMSMLVGMLVGTYLAGFIFKSGKIIEAKSEALEDLVQDSLEQGKEFLTELKSKKEKFVQKEGALEKEAPTAAPEKSARERLKDKGLL
jgi:cobalamin biosynthesis protein CobD/CbiB